MGDKTLNGEFILPREVEGQIVTMKIDPLGNRFDFTTTSGMQYTYSVYPQAINAKTTILEFRPVGKLKLPGGVQSLVADVKIVRGRAAPSSKTLKNLEVTEEASQPATRATTRAVEQDLAHRNALMPAQ